MPIGVMEKSGICTKHIIRRGKILINDTPLKSNIRPSGGVVLYERILGAGSDGTDRVSLEIRVGDNPGMSYPLDFSSMWN